MARHVIAQGRPGARRVVGVVAAAGVALAAVAGAASVNPRLILARAPIIGDECPSPRLPTTTLSITVAPDVAPVVQRIVDPLTRTELPDGNCLSVVYTQQAPAETVAGAQILPADRAPHLWIPDSSMWQMRTQKWRTEKVASFASSPVVIATSREAVQALGWSEQAPTWVDAMGGSLRPVAAPKIAQDAAGLSAVIAQYQAASARGAAAAQQGLAATVLAALRSSAPSREDAIAAAEAGASDAPLIPISEQGVARANDGSTGGNLVAVYPQGGSPTLDFPALQVESPTLTQQRRVAIKEVARALSSPSAAPVIKAAGLRNASGTGGAAAPLSTSGGPAADIKPLAPPPAQELEQLLTRVVSLSAPSRVLTVIDISGSMRLPAGNGMTRIRFSAEAAKAGGDYLPDVAQTGLWGFSRHVRGTENYIEFQELDELGAQDGSQTHRQAMVESMFGLANKLGGNGTAIYDVTIKAMRKMTEQYDPRAGNTVVLYTDGENVDPGGPTLQQTLQEMQRLFNPERPVRLLAVGVGPDADMAALKRMAEITGGTAVRVTDPRLMPKVVFEALSRRTS